MSIYSRALALVRVPPTAHEETARQARVLRVVVLSALALTLLMGIAVLLFISSPQESLFVVGALLLWELAVVVLMQRGWIRSASFLLTVGLCVNALACSFLFGGVRQVTFSSYVIVILTGGILLGKRAAALLAAIGVAGGLALLLAELTSSLPPADSLDPPTTWAAASATFAWAAVVLYMALGNIEEELERRAEEVRKRRRAQSQISRLHQETEKHLHHVQALHRIDQAITTSQELPTVLQVLLEQVTTQLQVDAAAVSLLSGAGRTLQVAARCGFRSTEFRAVGHGFQELLALRAVKQQQLVQVLDLERGESDPRLVNACHGENLISYFAAPLVAQRQVKGVLEVFTRSRLEPEAGWLEFFQALATQAAIAVDNARLFEDLQRSNADLTLAYDATIEGWARALELRDGETEGHSRRVMTATLTLARTLGFSEIELAHIRRGALLHDIGKMAIPDAILLKPGPLDTTEWEIMRRHPEYAVELLSPIPFLRPALDIPYCHHEKWDGSGYPRGLTGEAIPLAGRIFAIVDVWDALSSDRPYRRAWGRDQVRDYLLGQRGQHFDPNLLDISIPLLDDLA
jgi:HD-GYP domain-containing protein (c-di-GMP phosphodiesterase class II)